MDKVRQGELRYHGAQAINLGEQLLLPLPVLRLPRPITQCLQSSMSAGSFTATNIPGTELTIHLLPKQVLEEPPNFKGNP